MHSGSPLLERVVNPFIYPVLLSVYLCTLQAPWAGGNWVPAMSKMGPVIREPVSLLSEMSTSCVTNKTEP